MVVAELRVAALLWLEARAVLDLGLDRSVMQLGAAIYERGGVERTPAGVAEVDSATVFSSDRVRRGDKLEKKITLTRGLRLSVRQAGEESVGNCAGLRLGWATARRREERPERKEEWGGTAAGLWKERGLRWWAENRRG